MANISDANGTFTIHAKNCETIKELIHLMQYLEIGEYSTYFTDYHSGDDQFDDSIVKFGDDEYEFETTFSASGRWVYLTNIERMADWIHQKLKNKTTHKIQILSNILKRKNGQLYSTILITNQDANYLHK